MYEIVFHITYVENLKIKLVNFIWDTVYFMSLGHQMISWMKSLFNNLFIFVMFLFLQTPWHCNYGKTEEIGKKIHPQKEALVIFHLNFPTFFHTMFETNCIFSSGRIPWMGGWIHSWQGITDIGNHFEKWYHIAGIW